jgi:mannosyltransferase OCH1-like enzyme
MRLISGRQSWERERSIWKSLRRLLPLCLGSAIVIWLHSAFGDQKYPPSGYVERFPCKVWQSWKVDPLRFEDRDLERARTWTVKNPGYRYEVLTDDNALNYVEHYFGPSGFHRPDIVHAYKSLNARIIQADLLRYFIMYVEGGVYADIDVEALRSVDSFIPKRFDERDINMVIGVETDEPKLKDHAILGSKSQSFCQWTFMCKPRLPVILRLIENILVWLNEVAVEQGKPISEIDLDFDKVISGTGPSAFTKAILAEMSVSTGKEVTWDTFHNLEESKVVGGVLVLVSEAFAAGTGHSNSGNHGSRGALVKHHFHASSWTNHHPRYQHPIYGVVETCNWNVECVRLWDANVAFFDGLPKEEQLKMIAIKELDEREAFTARPQAEFLLSPDSGLSIPLQDTEGFENTPPAETPPARHKPPSDVPESFATGHADDGSDENSDKLANFAQGMHFGTNNKNG